MVAMVSSQSQPQTIHEMNFDDWYQSFKVEWHQGEHVVLCGPTGTGKTTIAHKFLDIRESVCVLAIKREDETLELFRHGKPRYTVITSWPPDYPSKRVILWKKPKSLHAKDIREQALSVHKALNQMYLSGGWCIYLDEAGYLAGTLGLGQAIGILLNQGRSAYISVVVVITRPASVVARIPKEALNQPRHKIFLKNDNEDEIKLYAAIANMPWRKMQELQAALQWYKAKNNTKYSDFLYIHEGKVILVRNV